MFMGKLAEVRQMRFYNVHVEGKSDSGQSILGVSPSQIRRYRWVRPATDLDALSGVALR